MKKVVFLYEKINKIILRDNLLILRRLWENFGYEVIEMEVEEQNSADKYMSELVRLKEDFLVTFAMAGFVWHSIAGQVRFNLLATMQIHLLIGNMPYYDSYLRKEYGIQNFFVTDSEEIFSGWEKKYPQLLFLDRIPALYMAEYLTDTEKQANRINLQEMLQRIFSFIENPSVL